MKESKKNLMTNELGVLRRKLARSDKHTIMEERVIKAKTKQELGFKVSTELSQINKQQGGMLSYVVGKSK